MRWPKRTGEKGAPAPSPVTSQTLPGEGFTRVFITIDAALVIFLAFAFAFGNGWTTARKLGIHPYIAPFIQPAVDLAVIGLMVGLRYLAVHGWTDDQLKMPRRWLRFFGVLTLGMNTALPLSEHLWGRAAWDAIGPILLIAWSELAPWLLRAIYSVREQQALADLEVPEPQPELAAVDESADETDDEQAKEPNVIDMKPTNTRLAVKRYLVSWALSGKTRLDEPAAAFYREMAQDPSAVGVLKCVSKRRVGQLVEEEWPAAFKLARTLEKGAQRDVISV